MNAKAKPVLLIVVIALIGSAAALSTWKTFARGDLRTLSAGDISAYRWEALARFYASQPNAGTDLTGLSPADNSGHRRQPPRRFYASQPKAGVDLTSLSPADISAYRWQALAHFYADHPMLETSQALP